MAINAAHVELATKINALEGKLIYGPRTYYSEHITGQHEMLPFDRLTALSPVDGPLQDRVTLSLRHRMALLRAASDAVVREPHHPEPRRWAATGPRRIVAAPSYGAGDLQDHVAL